MRYEGDITDAITNVKRLYVDDLVIERDCPECGAKVKIDFSDQYISYGDDELNFYCSDGCEHEWTIQADLTAKLVLETHE